jgi:hypothetical protein
VFYTCKGTWSLGVCGSAFYLRKRRAAFWGVEVRSYLPRLGFGGLSGSGAG